MRRLGLFVLPMFAWLLVAGPATANYSYSAGLSVTPTTVVAGGAETLTYHVVASPNACPTGPVWFFVDSTTIAKVPALTPSSCSAVAHYTVPRSIQCGQHSFEATMESNSVPAIGYEFAIRCPNTPGGILWGSSSGSAIVHNTLTMNAPRVPTGAVVRYYWKVGSTYTSNHTRHYTLPWSTSGKYVYGVVRVDENPGTRPYWRFYKFGPVKG